MKKCISAILFLFIFKATFSQLLVGLAYGTFNVPAAYNFKGYGPTLRIEYTGENETQQLFLDASLYKKSQNGYGTQIYNDQAVYIGTTESITNYNIWQLQLGFKRSLAGDFDESRLNCFLGGGVAASFVKTTQKYSLAGYSIPDNKLIRSLFGFHFNTGAQLRLKPFVLELRGNFDLVLKPITIEAGDNTSNILTSLRIGITYPIFE
jgi:hypothetical protein